MDKMEKINLPKDIIEKWSEELSKIYEVPDDFWKDIEKHIGIEEQEERGRILKLVDEIEDRVSFCSKCIGSFHIFLQELKQKMEGLNT